MNDSSPLLPLLPDTCRAGERLDAPTGLFVLEAYSTNRRHQRRRRRSQPPRPVASCSTGPIWLGQRTHLKLHGTGADSA